MMNDTLNKFQPRFLIALLVTIMLLLSFQPAEAQVAGAQFDTHPMHWARFWARGLFDRNLIWCPLWNIGNLSDSGVEPGRQMMWPGSQGLSYVSKANFYVGALITDMSAYKGKVIPEKWDGTQFPIVSVSYLPHTAVGIVAKLSSDRTHQQIWQPMPYYFNDGQFGVIWGINEDVNKDGELQPEEDINFNGKLDFNLDPPESILKSMAISTDKRTWPEYWPAGSYIGDDRPVVGRPPRTINPGRRAGLWNGEYKAGTIADQETIYLMDDHENDYLNDFKKPLQYWPMKNPDGTPDTTVWADGGIAGTGVEVESRSYAWFHPLAEDLLVSVYRVRNYSDYTLDRVVTGMFADANVGQAEYNAVDYIRADYDVAQTRGRLSFDILYQWHQFPEQIETWKKIGTFGFAFLESPGIDYNFKDDDADSLIDESMSDGIDNDGDWRGFADIGLDRIGPDDPIYSGPDPDGTEGNGVWDTEDTNMNGALDIGEDKNQNDRLDMEPVNDDRGTDGIGPDENGWLGPDPDGTEVNGRFDLGEPNFDLTDIDEADQAGLKHVYAYEPNTTDLKIGEVFWDKYLRWETEGDEGIEETDENIAFTFGARAVRLDTMIWRRFVIALIMGEDQEDAIRNKATMQRIYNNNYRFLTPPLQPNVVSNVGDRKVQLYWDTEAERSKDPFFGEDFNGYRVYRSTDPKFLDIKKISDAFGNVLLFKPMVIFDRNDDGGLKGPHPVPFPNLGAHYDMGNNSGLRHSYTDTTVENGRTYFYVVTSIDAGNDDDFYERGIVSIDYPMKAMPSESPFNITVNELGEVVYRDKNTAVVVPVEPAAGYVNPHVDSTKIRHISGFANGGVLQVDVFNKYHARLGNEYELQFDDDHWLDDLTGGQMKWGSTTGMRCLNITTGDTLFDYTYDSGYFFNRKAFLDVEKGVFEGLKFHFTFPVNNRDRRKEIEVNQENEYHRKTKQWQRWVTKTKSNLRVEDIELGGEGFALPFDLEIRVTDNPQEGKSVKNAFWEKEFDTNFSLWNLADPNNPQKMEMKVLYGYARREIPPEEYYGQIWEGTNIVVMFKDKNGYYQASWNLIFLKNELEKDNPVIPPEPGDIFRLRFFSNPTRFDKYRFTVEGGDWVAEQAKREMRDIYVVPDPYIVASSFEPIYELAGFSQRRVDFVNLPPKCTIKIFTASGRLVKTIEHDAPNDFGRHSWDLTTEDGPEVAFGMYFFVVESKDLGISRGKFAVIK